MSGRLVGPKTWGRIVGNIWNPFWDNLGIVFGWLCDNLYNKLWFLVFLGRKWPWISVPLLGEWAAHGQPTARLGTVKNSPGLLGWTAHCSFRDC